MRYAAKVDGNHGEVRDWLRARAWYVRDVSRYPKFFDLIASKDGRTCFVEAKNWNKPPSARKLTPAQVLLHAEFIAAGLDVVVVETEADLAQFERPFSGRYYDQKTAAGM
jgi:hypothetical protein